MLSGALRRLALSLCGDHDDTRCYQIAVIIGSLAKRSAHVAGVCRRFPCQITVILSLALSKYTIYELHRLSAGSELIR